MKKVLFVLLFFMFLICPVFAQKTLALSDGMSVIISKEFKQEETMAFVIAEDNVHINILDVDIGAEQVSNEEIIGEIVNELKQQWDSYEVIKKNEFKINGYPAILLKGKMYSAEAGINIIITQYLIFANNKLYNINCACPESVAEKYSKIFENIAGSFKKN